ncbi:MAG: GNAT family N-acetyltransferase [Acidobacteria bacterium]|nr:GNAT family N-acetyltransferase [Acidobacteriota bacterium]
MQLPIGCIRSFRQDDARALARYANNRNIWLNLRDRFPHPYMIDDARRFLEGVVGQAPETVFAIDIDSEAAGAIGLILHEDVERCSAELGYWLGEPFWGRGVMTEAVKGVTAHAFEAFSLTRVYAVPFASNLASARVLEKAGYVLEARLRRSAIKADVVTDQLLYATVR